MSLNTASQRKHGPDHQTDEAKRSASERMARVWERGRDGVMREDQRVLRELGCAVAAEYGAVAGCTPFVARKRLLVLVEHGLAEGYKKPGHGNVVYYVATAPPGSSERLELVPASEVPLVAPDQVREF